ncbi:MAG: CARDB domain-containing protein [bacterium]
MKKNIPNPILRGALIAGMLVIVIFALIGITRIVPKAINSIGSAFSSMSSSLFSPKETIVVSLSNNSVQTGETVDVSFEHNNKSGAGVYEFKFDCTSKDLSMILIDGNNQTNMPCTATSTVSSNIFKIIPQLKDQNSFVDSYIYVTYFNKENNSKKVVGKTVLTVQNGTTKGLTNQTGTSSQIIATSSSITKKTNTTYSQPSPTTNVVRKPDLYIVTKNAGTVINGVYIPKTTFGAYESPIIKFDIGNDGNVETGPWQFTAVLPTIHGQVFPSGIQPSLKPGEIIEYTLTLGNLAVTGNNVVSINVDPTQSVSELSETNNTAVMTLLNSGARYSTGLILPNNYNNYNYNYYNNSNSDLMLRIISKGYIDRNNGRYYVASSVSENNRVAVRFEIENIGTGETGPFIFTADLSGYSEDRYTSPVQTTFYPGEKRQYTVDFDSGAADIGTNTVTIRLDTNNNVVETNEDNNVLSEDILVY